MKVLEINSVCNGSTGKIACDLARKLIKDGHECKIAYGRGNPPKEIPSIKIGSRASVFFHGLKARLFDKSGFGSAFATKKLIKEIEIFNPDIIHLHNIHGYYIDVKLLFNYLKQSKKKVIWTLHDCWSFTGHCCYFDYAKCDKWKTECSKCKSKNDYPKSLISKAKINFYLKKEIFNSLDKNQLILVTPSLWLKKLVNQSYLNQYQTIVINNGIDTSIFKYTDSDIKKRFNLENKKIILGVASVWDRRKGLTDFIELSTKLNDEYKIVLIGLKKEQIKKLPANIIGINRTDNIRELVQWYSAANVFLNPTYEDNYPTVLLEAISCNLCVLTSPVGGCLEIASMSSSCDIIDKKNIIEQIENLSNVKNYLLLGYDISIEQFANKYVNLYSSIIEK